MRVINMNKADMIIVFRKISEEKDNEFDRIRIYTGDDAG